MLPSDFLSQVNQTPANHPTTNEMTGAAGIDEESIPRPFAYIWVIGSARGS